MNKSTYIKTLDLQKRGVQFTVNANQNEALSRQLIINITDCGKPFDFGNGELTAVLFATKSDNTVLYNACEVDNSTVSYTLTQQTLTSPGEVRARLLIVAIDNIEDALDAIENNALGESETVQVLYSPEFCIFVDEVEAYDGAIESTDEYTALTQASATALAAATAANTAASSASEAAGNISASVTQSASGATITVTDANGTTTTANITNGAKGDSGAVGATGAKGADGYSPTVETSAITGGHKVTITDAQGDHDFNVMDGESGIDYTMGDTMDDTGNVLNVKSSYIESQTGRKRLDLSSNKLNSPLILNTLVNGIYDIADIGSNGGYVSITNGTAKQRTQLPVGTLLVIGGGYATFFSQGSGYCVDLAGTEVENWLNGYTVTFQDLIGELADYLSKTEAQTAYQQKVIRLDNQIINDWTSDSLTHTGYNYKRSFSITGVNAGSTVNVYPDLATVMSGNLMPTADLSSGTVTLFSKTNDTAVIERIEVIN
jgi:hypothetical protein